MIRMPNMFSDHMVLQQEKKVKIFGTADSGKKIAVCLKDGSGKTEAEGGGISDKDGNFMIELPPLKAGTEKNLIITDGGTTVVLTDVAVGEVWLAGGQSNMEYLMNFDAERNQEKEGLKALSEEERAFVRFFDCPEISYEGMEETADFSNFGKWRCLTEEDLPYFSAVSYYFERKLAGSLSCPVGVIGCNWGGTRASCWIPEETIREAGAEVWIRDYEEGLKDIPDLEKTIELYKKSGQNLVDDPAAPPSPFSEVMFPGLSHKQQQKADETMAGAGEDTALMMTILPIHPWRPAGLYHTMLRKVMPYTLRGFIYYQGCSDEGHSDLYAACLEALIRRWRADWGDETLPFLMVQLAPFGEWMGNYGTEYPTLRASQLEVAGTLENVYVASIGDAGMRYDIHPKHKRKPGERLGLLALSHVYGADVPADAPAAKDMVFDGDTAVIRFENGSGLHLSEPENGGLTEEELIAAGVREPDEPEVLSPEENLNTLIKTVPEGEVHAEVKDGQLRVTVIRDGKTVRPETICFAWTPYYEINVKNEAGLPVYPFIMK